MKPRVVVTGASGYVGQHVIKALASHGVTPVAMIHQTPLPSDLSAVETVRLDLREGANDAYARLGKPDTVIHLAWGGLPNYTSLHHFTEELPAHFRFLSELVHGGLTRLVGVGTCLEYGLQSGPLAASTPTRPHTAYGYAKAALHEQLNFLRAAHPFQLAWARIFYLYGEGQPRGSIYAKLREAVMRGDPTFPMTGGEQLRDFLPVEAVAEQLASLSLETSVGRFNICSGQPISVRRLVDNWIADHQWGISPELGRVPYSPLEPLAFWGVPGGGDGVSDPRITEAGPTR